jgi:pyrimidine operon attenuation protein/uracil phosphoribosyltransferase
MSRNGANIWANIPYAAQNRISWYDTRDMTTQNKQILTNEDIQRILIRIAHEIAERNDGIQHVLLVGIRQRGFSLAERLARLLLEIEGEQVVVGQLDIPIRQDTPDRHTPPPPVQNTGIPADTTGYSVVLVDDVLYTGRTVHAALNALVGPDHPERVQFAVLIDRGHRELPIRADFIGREVPTSRKERVEVRLTEVDGQDEVVIIHPETSG